MAVAQHQSDEEFARSLQEQLDAESNYLGFRHQDERSLQLIQKFVELNHLDPDAVEAAFTGEEDPDVAFARKLQEEEFGVLGASMRADAAVAAARDAGDPLAATRAFVAAAQGRPAYMQAYQAPAPQPAASSYPSQRSPSPNAPSPPTSSPSPTGAPGPQSHPLPDAPSLAMPGATTPLRLPAVSTPASNPCIERIALRRAQRLASPPSAKGPSAAASLAFASASPARADPAAAGPPVALRLGSHSPTGLAAWRDGPHHAPAAAPTAPEGTGCGGRAHADAEQENDAPMWAPAAPVGDAADAPQAPLDAQADLVPSVPAAAAAGAAAGALLASLAAAVAGPRTRTSAPMRDDGDDGAADDDVASADADVAPAADVAGGADGGVDDADEDGDDDELTNDYDTLLQLAERVGSVPVGVPRVLVDRHAPARAVRPEEGAVDCVVCLDPLGAEGLAREMPICRHVFHAECIETSVCVAIIGSPSCFLSHTSFRGRTRYACSWVHECLHISRSFFPP